ncbi:MAG: peptidoglycan-binding protein [Alphaproteobacteria bacterium]
MRWRAALLAAAAVGFAWTTARADFAAGFAAFQAGDFAGAWTLLEPEAEADDRRAQFLLGEMLLKGLGREQDQFAAAGWFQRAVREPDPDRYALYALASQYFNGDGVPQDVPNAIALYERAASLGDLDAMRSLAAIHARGEAVPQDLNAALRWLFAAVQASEGQDDHAAAVERFNRLANAAGRTPPFAGRWIAIAYVAPADHPSWPASPDFLPGLVGGRLQLDQGSFAMPGATCGRPAFIAGSTTAADLSQSLAGAMPYGGLALDDPTPLATLMVVCDGALAATAVRLNEERLLVSALGGALVFETSPSPTVRTAQRLLRAIGYDPGPIDGLFGPRTGAALQAFQTGEGLLPTGAFDGATMFALESAAAEEDEATGTEGAQD